MSKKFKRLLVPEGYRHYWSKYPEGYTILEALLNWVDSVNQLTENVNDWNIYLDDFVENFDEKLAPTVREMLNEMETDGRLAEIINEEIFSWKADKEYVDTEFNKIDSQLAQIVTDVKLNDGEDATTKIQDALDKKGHVRVLGAGTILTGRLLIDDDTKLEIMPGVTLKRKDGTNHYILVNRGHVEGYRNKNITLKGGNWDLNRSGNPNAGGDLSTDIQAWSGLGILFHKVDNLVVEDIQEIGNEHKYCFLVADINQGRFSNLDMVNESDGLHLQPPLNNITIEDISGLTEDDLISFTMGDYPRYSLGQHGDVENVIVRNIHGREGTAELIKMVGSGLDGNSVFRNMKFENLSGFANVFPVYIMKEDQATPNPTLKDTQLENIVFENINAVPANENPVFSIGGVSGDITIRKLKVSQEHSARPILLNKCNFSKVVLEDIHITPGTESMTTTTSIVNISNDAEVVDQLIISNSNITLNAVAGNHLIYNTGGKINNVHINACKVIQPGGTTFTLNGESTNRPNIFVDNSDLSSNMFANVSIPLNINISNSVVQSDLRTLHLNDGADVRLKSVNSDLILTLNGTTAERKLSISGDITSDILHDRLTPKTGDTFFYDRPTAQRNKGKYQYDGTKWVRRLSVTDVNTDIIVGTVSAHSTAEFTIPMPDTGVNKVIVANPTFAVPNGIIYNVVNRQKDSVRLRFANVTSSDITFDENTQIAWNLKVINDSALVG